MKNASEDNEQAITEIRFAIGNILDRYEDNDYYPSTDIELITTVECLSVAVEVLLECANSATDSVRQKASQALKDIADIL